MVNSRTLQWRFLDTGAGSAAFNMAMDEALVDSVQRGASPPVFRAYRWDSPSISVGYSQDTGRAVDVGRCRDDGIPITRRLTGGRAVYHDDEIAYSVIASVNDPHVGGDIALSHNRIGMILCSALTSVGVDVSLNRGSRGDDRIHLKKGNPCFISTSRYEITCGGRKIVGSAQRRFKTVFLQHGSILLGPSQHMIAAYMTVSDESRRAIRRMIDEGATCLKAELGEAFSGQTMIDGLLESLRSTVACDVRVDEPSRDEYAAAERLRIERYGAKGWILGDERHISI